MRLAAQSATSSNRGTHRSAWTLVVAFVALYFVPYVLLGVWAPLLLPLVAGGGIAILRPPSVLRVIDSIDEWFSVEWAIARSVVSGPQRWARTTLIGVFGLIARLSERVRDPAVRAGARVAGYGLIGAFLGFGITAGILFVAFGALALIVLWLVFSFLFPAALGALGFGSAFWAASGFAAGVAGALGKAGGAGASGVRAGLGDIRGSRLVRDSVWMPGELLARIDLDGRVWKPGLLLDEDTGMRVDASGVVRASGFGGGGAKFAIGDEGSIREVSGFFDVPTGYRMDEDGRILRSGLVGDTYSGLRVVPDAKRQE